jgi:hypothetical protein
MNAIGMALAAVLGVLGVRWLLQQRPKRRERAQVKALMLECDGDQELVERLIFSEMDRDEGIDFAEAVRRARNKLRRDRR